jgi:hypothetical protein
MAIERCAHPGCNCAPEQDSNYCSDFCKNADPQETKEESGCGCGDPQCGGDEDRAENPE